MSIHISIYQEPKIMQKYCLVEKCRFPHLHTTRGHQCLCGKFGHGRIECTDQYKKNMLNEKVKNNKIVFPRDLYCKIDGCKNPSTHTDSSHICSFCGGRNHDISTCDSYKQMQQKDDNYKIKCPMCRTENIIPKNQSKIVGCEMACIVCMGKANMFLPKCGHINICLDCIKEIDSNTKKSTNGQQIDYIDQLAIDNNGVEPSSVVREFNDGCFDFNIYCGGNIEELKRSAGRAFGNNNGKIVLCANAGMGSSWFIKRNFINDEIKIYFMHGDSWGQYGPETSCVEELNNFVEGYRPIKN